MGMPGIAMVSISIRPHLALGARGGIRSWGSWILDPQAHKGLKCWIPLSFITDLEAQKLVKLSRDLPCSQWHPCLGRAVISPTGCESKASQVLGWHGFRNWFATIWNQSQLFKLKDCSKNITIIYITKTHMARIPNQNESFLSNVPSNDLNITVYQEKLMNWILFNNKCWPMPCQICVFVATWALHCLPWAKVVCKKIDFCVKVCEHYQI